jgi:hypothetical protein
MSRARSARPEVRNPLFGLPAAKDISALPPEARLLVSALLEDLARDARSRAEAAWKRNKGPMALRRLARVLRPPPQAPQTLQRRKGKGRELRVERLSGASRATANTL